MTRFYELVAAVKVPTDGIPEVDLNQNTLNAILSSVFIAIGAVAVFFLLVGAARYVTSNGEQAKITQAKNTILYAIVGILISLVAFGIVQFTLGVVGGR
ncbi:MAG: hypothetical protein ACREGJ_04170 [Candidatus Saccharimonadales bacterium]